MTSAGSVNRLGNHMASDRSGPVMSLKPAPIGVFAGLTEQEARARLDAEGYNELPRHDRRTPLRIVLEVLREPMLALLLGAGFVYLLLGDLKEALILLAFGAMSIVITVIQETRCACRKLNPGDGRDEP